jgi:hypothetical protein
MVKEEALSNLPIPFGDPLSQKMFYTQRLIAPTPWVITGQPSGPQWRTTTQFV